MESALRLAEGSQQLDDGRVFAGCGQKSRQGQGKSRLLLFILFVGQDELLDLDFLVDALLGRKGSVVGRESVQVVGQVTERAVAILHQCGQHVGRANHLG